MYTYGRLSIIYTCFITDVCSFAVVMNSLNFDVRKKKSNEVMLYFMITTALVFNYRAFLLVIFRVLVMNSGNQTDDKMFMKNSFSNVYLKRDYTLFIHD